MKWSIICAKILFIFTFATYMRNTKPIISFCFAIIAVAVVMLQSCYGRIEYSTSPEDRLSFSCDTLELDSIFVGVTSASGMLVAYNGNDRAIRFDALLCGGNDSPFQMSVDGFDGTSIAGLEVAPHDSVICFVRVRTTGVSDNPVSLLLDSIAFLLESGVSQYVVLSASSVNAVRLDGSCITQDTHFDARLPYLIYDSLYVASGACLEIAPGTSLYFHNGAFLKADGRILALGTRDSQILFAGDRLDRVLEDLPYSLLDSQWKGIELGIGSFGNRFENCMIRGGEFGLRADSSNCDRSKFELVSSIVHNVTGNCIEAEECRIAIANSQITNAGEYCMDIRGGRTEVVFSTIASLSVWNMGIAAVSLAPGAADTAFDGAVFRDCIITGRHADEFLVSDSVLEKYSDRIDVSHSLVLTKDTARVFYHGAVFEHQSSDLSGAANFIGKSVRGYDSVFLPDSLSRARGIADSLSVDWPQDLCGTQRPVSGADAGCYQSFFAE